MKNNLIVPIIVAVIVGGAGFFGGMQYQKSQVSSFAGGQGEFRQRMMGQSADQGQVFRPVRGNILSIDNNTITVKLQDGSSKIVILSGSTTYMREVSSAKTDLKTGDTVAVIGSNNSDGSITAQNIQINPTTFLREATRSGR